MTATSRGGVAAGGGRGARRGRRERRRSDNEPSNRCRRRNSHDRKPPRSGSGRPAAPRRVSEKAHLPDPGRRGNPDALRKLRERPAGLALFPDAASAERSCGVAPWRSARNVVSRRADSRGGLRRRSPRRSRCCRGHTIGKATPGRDRKHSCRALSCRKSPRPAAGYWTGGPRRGDTSCGSRSLIAAMTRGGREVESRAPHPLPVARSLLPAPAPCVTSQGRDAPGIRAIAQRSPGIRSKRRNQAEINRR